MISKVHGSGILFWFGIQLLVIGILVEGRGCVISSILQIGILIVPLWPPIIENMKDIQSVVEIFG